MNAREGKYRDALEGIKAYLLQHISMWGDLRTALHRIVHQYEVVLPARDFREDSDVERGEEVESV